MPVELSAPFLGLTRKFKSLARWLNLRSLMVTLGGIALLQPRETTTITFLRILLKNGSTSGHISGTPF
jgi:hypothetical protein